MIAALLDSIRSMDCSQMDDEFINDILDGRDMEVFDSEWCKTERNIRNLKNNHNYTELNKKENERIRQEAFFIIESKISSELSDYISDDFGLIYDSIVVGYEDDWLNKLISEYQHGRIPYGKL